MGSRVDPLSLRKAVMPRSQLMALSITNFSQAVMLTLPFTVAVFMVRAWEPGGGEETIGRLTGLLAAVYSLTQTTTSYAWGVWSTAHGRKPVMVIGTAVSAAALVWFGLAGSYAGAAAARAAAGLLNGVLCAWKCIIGESCDSLLQGKVMAMMSLSWGLGCVAGPLIGGLLSQPCEAWPGAPLCGEGGALRHRPYLLPCLVAAACSVVSCAVNVVWLQETLPALVIAAQQLQQGQEACGGAAARRGAGVGALARRLGALWRGRGYSRLDGGGGGGDSSCCGGGGGPGGLGRIDSASDYERGGAGGKGGAKGGWALAKGERRPYARVGAGDGEAERDGGGGGGGGAHGGGALAGGDLELSVLGPAAAEGGAAVTEGGAAAAAAAGGAAAANCSAAVAEGGARDGTDGGGGGGLSVEGAQPDRRPHVARVDSSWLLQAYRRPPAPAAPDSSGGGSGDDAAASGSDDRSPRPRGAAAGGPAPISSAAAAAAAGPARAGRYSGARVVRDASVSGGGGAEGDDERRSLLALPAPSKASDGPRADTSAAAAARSSSSSSSSDGGALGSPRADCTAGPEGGAADQPWYRSGQVVLAVLGYGAVCLLFSCLDEVVPIFASAPVAEGGLGMEEADLAVPLALNGGCLILFSLLGYPPLQRAFGTLPVSRAGLLGAAAVATLVPLPSLAAAAGAPLPQTSALLTAVLALKAVVQVSAFTGAMILVNLLPRPEHLGAVNGAGQTLASLVRGLGPLIGGVLWGAALRVAGGQFLVFGAVAAVALAAAGLFAFLRPPPGEEEARRPQRGGGGGAVGAEV
ncbi:MAG: hypothetical protein J3K34DRAFT_462986 [Monoraphidium minutum]|nr:MAG: hypothetical protein J3K34DRAFT_462986 [Monoraphidium minutum]